MHRYKADKAAVLQSQLGKKDLENHKKLKHIMLFIMKNSVKGVLPSKTKVIQKKYDLSLPNWLQQFTKICPFVLDYKLAADIANKSCHPF